MNTITLIDDSNRWLSAAEMQISKIPDFHLQCKFTNGIDFINWCYHSRAIPDLAIIDVEMPVMDGVQLTDFLTANFPEIKVIGLSSYINIEVVEDMFACGAYAYISKHFDARNLCSAILAVVEGETYVDPLLGIPGIDRNRLMNERKNQKASLNLLGFTPRQKAIMSLYGSSAHQREIAKIFSVSLKTVENHVRDISLKLEVKSRQELTLKNIRKGIIRLARIFHDGHRVPDKI
jgi:DNA-binding NarL/FixJ family response regulator